MKTLIVLAALLVAGVVQAEERVAITKMKCSFFGNLKIKVKGLDAYRSLGRGYLAANVPLFDSCKSALNEVSSRIGRSSQSSVVNTSRYISRTTEYRDSRRNDGSGRNRQIPVCVTSEVTTLAMKFNRMPELTFKRSTQRHLRTRRGYCY